MTATEPTEEILAMNRTSILETALSVVTKDRNTSYGEPEDVFTDIAVLWESLFGRKFSTTDIALAMIAVKMARLKANPGHGDSWVDLAGYAACGGELAVRNYTKPKQVKP